MCAGSGKVEIYLELSAGEHLIWPPPRHGGRGRGTVSACSPKPTEALQEGRACSFPRCIPSCPLHLKVPLPDGSSWGSSLLSSTFGSTSECLLDFDFCSPGEDPSLHCNFLSFNFSLEKHLT